MNAAVMASGWEHGGVDGAKTARWAPMRIHCIACDRATEVDASSKPITEWRFLQALRDEGRRSAGPFLEQHGANLGKRSTLDLDAMPAAC
jgi:NTE family protein